jgi:hypothetical protein
MLPISLKTVAVTTLVCLSAIATRAKLSRYDFYKDSVLGDLDIKSQDLEIIKPLVDAEMEFGIVHL